MGDPEQRFWSKVDRSGDCWVWLAGTSTVGYGRVYWNGRFEQAHRIAYELTVGPIGDGLQLDHLCRNRLCVNPAHLEPVTGAVNVHRSPDWIGNRTHCPKGHEREPGEAHCRECNREACARRYAQIKAANDARRTSTTCIECENEFIYTGGRRRTLCSDECRRIRLQGQQRLYARQRRAQG